jgi:hypothetical protein
MTNPLGRARVHLRRCHLLFFRVCCPNLEQLCELDAGHSERRRSQSLPNRTIHQPTSALEGYRSVNLNQPGDRCLHKMTRGTIAFGAAPVMRRRVIDGGRSGQNEDGQTVSDCCQPSQGAKCQLIVKLRKCHLWRRFLMCLTKRQFQSMTSFLLCFVLDLHLTRHVVKYKSCSEPFEISFIFWAPI